MCTANAHYLARAMYRQSFCITEFVSKCFSGGRACKRIQNHCARNAEVTIIKPMEPIPRILIVDDDFEIRSLLADYLESNGYHAVTAQDGVSMAQALADMQIDLLVLDLNLPGQGGLGLCRKLGAGSSLPVIMLTARGDPLDRIVGLEMGADDYMPKPFEPREL